MPTQEPNYKGKEMGIVVVNSLDSVTLKVKEYSVPDLKNVTKSSSNVKITPTTLSANFKSQVAYVPKNTAKIKKIFTVWDKFYINYQDGSVFAVNENDELLVSYVWGSGDYTIVPVLFKGEKSALIIERGERAEVVGGLDITSVDIPAAEHYLTLGNLFFIASGNFLSYTSSPDLLDFKGDITFPLDSGKITGLAALGKKLVVVCEFAVYVVTAFGEAEDYVVTRLATISNATVNGTVIRVLDSVVFTDGEQLYSFNGKSLDKIAVAGGLNGYEIDGVASVDNDCYVLPLLKDGEKYLFRHGFNDDSDAFIKVQNNAVTNGYAVVGGNVVTICESEQGEPLEMGEWESALMDFGAAGKKTLAQISATVQGKVDITVGKTSGSKTFNFNSKSVVKRPNYTANGFVFTARGKDFTLKNLNLKYTEKGVN